MFQSMSSGNTMIGGALSIPKSNCYLLILLGPVKHSWLHHPLRPYVKKKFFFPADTEMFYYKFSLLHNLFHFHFSQFLCSWFRCSPSTTSSTSSWLSSSSSTSSGSPSFLPLSSRSRIAIRNISLENNVDIAGSLCRQGQHWGCEKRFWSWRRFR